MIKAQVQHYLGTTAARAAMEAAAFALAAVAVVWSAQSMKRWSPTPPLAAVDSPAKAATPGGEALEFLAASVSVPPVIAPAAPAIVPEPAADPRGPVFSAPEGYERYFDGRPIRPVKTMLMTVTAYSPDHRSCGKWADGWTASMKSVWTNGGNLVAADKKLLPFGSLVSVPGYAGSDVVPVLDIGGAIKGRRLDVLYPTHAIARKWGVRKLAVTVWEYAD